MDNQVNTSMAEPDQTKISIDTPSGTLSANVSTNALEERLASIIGARNTRELVEGGLDLNLSNTDGKGRVTLGVHTGRANRKAGQPSLPPAIIQTGE